MAAGINGKMSEFNAALGLLQLKHIDLALVRRREIDAMYRERLAGVNGLRCVENLNEKVANYAYFPIMVEPEYPVNRDALYDELASHKIFARRYFYPLISDFPMYRGFPSAQRGNLPVASAVAERILCLPIYPNLRDDELEKIVDIVARRAAG